MDSLLILFLVTVGIPGAVTFGLPKRWFVWWAILVAMLSVWLWTRPLDGPGAVFASFGITIVVGFNMFLVAMRVIATWADFTKY